MSVSSEHTSAEQETTEDPNNHSSADEGDSTVIGTASSAWTTARGRRRRDIEDCSDSDRPYATDRSVKKSDDDSHLRLKFSKKRWQNKRHRSQIEKQRYLHGCDDRSLYRTLPSPQTLTIELHSPFVDEENNTNDDDHHLGSSSAAAANIDDDGEGSSHSSAMQTHRAKPPTRRTLAAAATIAAPRIKTDELSVPSQIGSSSVGSTQKSRNLRSPPVIQPPLTPLSVALSLPKMKRSRLSLTPFQSSGARYSDVARRTTSSTTSGSSRAWRSTLRSRAFSDDASSVSGASSLGGSTLSDFYEEYGEVPEDSLTDESYPSDYSDAARDGDDEWDPLNGSTMTDTMKQHGLSSSSSIHPTLSCNDFGILRSVTPPPTLRTPIRSREKMDDSAGLLVSSSQIDNVVKHQSDDSTPSRMKMKMVVKTPKKSQIGRKLSITMDDESTMNDQSSLLHNQKAKRRRRAPKSVPQKNRKRAFFTADTKQKSKKHSFQTAKLGVSKSNAKRKKRKRRSLRNVAKAKRAAARAEAEKSLPSSILFAGEAGSTDGGGSSSVNGDGIRPMQMAQPGERRARKKRERRLLKKLQKSMYLSDADLGLLNADKTDSLMSSVNQRKEPKLMIQESKDDVIVAVQDSVTPSVGSSELMSGMDDHPLKLPSLDETSARKTNEVADSEDIQRLVDDVVLEQKKKQQKRMKNAEKSHRDSSMKDGGKSKSMLMNPSLMVQSRHDNDHKSRKHRNDTRIKLIKDESLTFGEKWFKGKIVWLNWKTKYHRSERWGIIRLREPILIPKYHQKILHLKERMLREVRFFGTYVTRGIEEKAIKRGGVGLWVEFRIGINNSYYDHASLVAESARLAQFGGGSSHFSSNLLSDASTVPVSRTMKIGRKGGSPGSGSGSHSSSSSSASSSSSDDFTSSLDSPPLSGSASIKDSGDEDYEKSKADDSVSLDYLPTASVISPMRKRKYSKKGRQQQYGPSTEDTIEALRGLQGFDIDSLRELIGVVRGQANDDDQSTQNKELDSLKRQYRMKKKRKRGDSELRMMQGLMKKTKEERERILADAASKSRVVLALSHGPTAEMYATEGFSDFYVAYDVRPFDTKIPTRFHGVVVVAPNQCMGGHWGWIHCDETNMMYRIPMPMDDRLHLLPNSIVSFTPYLVSSRSLVKQAHRDGYEHRKRRKRREKSMKIDDDSNDDGSSSTDDYYSSSLSSSSSSGSSSSSSSLSLYRRKKKKEKKKKSKSKKKKKMDDKGDASDKEEEQSKEVELDERKMQKLKVRRNYYRTHGFATLDDVLSAQNPALLLLSSSDADEESDQSDHYHQRRHSKHKRKQLKKDSSYSIDSIDQSSDEDSNYVSAGDMETSVEYPVPKYHHTQYGDIKFGEYHATSIKLCESISGEIIESRFLNGNQGCDILFDKYVYGREISERESLTIEYKCYDLFSNVFGTTDLDIIVESSEKYLNGFANGQYGGMICFGIRDNGIIIGQQYMTREKEDQIRLQIDSRIKRWKPTDYAYQLLRNHIKVEFVDVIRYDSTTTKVSSAAFQQRRAVIHDDDSSAHKHHSISLLALPASQSHHPPYSSPPDSSSNPSTICKVDSTVSSSSSSSSSSMFISGSAAASATDATGLSSGSVARLVAGSDISAMGSSTKNPMKSMNHQRRMTYSKLAEYGYVLPEVKVVRVSVSGPVFNERTGQQVIFTSSKGEVWNKFQASLVNVTKNLGKAAAKRMAKTAVHRSQVPSMRPYPSPFYRALFGHSASQLMGNNSSNHPPLLHPSVLQGSPEHSGGFMFDSGDMLMDSMERSHSEPRLLSRDHSGSKKSRHPRPHPSAIAAPLAPLTLDRRKRKKIGQKKSANHRISDHTKFGSSKRRKKKRKTDNVFPPSLKMSRAMSEDTPGMHERVRFNQSGMQKSDKERVSVVRSVDRNHDQRKCDSELTRMDDHSLLSDLS